MVWPGCPSWGCCSDWRCLSEPQSLCPAKMYPGIYSIVTPRSLILTPACSAPWSPHTLGHGEEACGPGRVNQRPHCPRSQWSPLPAHPGNKQTEQCAGGLPYGAGQGNHLGARTPGGRSGSGRDLRHVQQDTSSRTARQDRAAPPSPGCWPREANRGGAGADLQRPDSVATFPSRGKCRVPVSRVCLRSSQQDFVVFVT